MKNFFIDDQSISKFQLFGFLHISLMVLLIIGILLLVVNKEKIAKMNEKIKDKIRISIALILFLNMTIYYLTRIIYGVYDWKVHLPLHFCFIAGYLFMFAVIFKKWKLYKISYFMAFMGPLPAIIWPELYRTFDTYIFYQYLISHHFFLLSNLFILYAYSIKITKKDFIKTIIVVFTLFICMAIFNFFFHTNYIFSTEIPPHVLELYPFLVKFNYPVILIFLIGLIIMFLAYAFYLLTTKKNH